MTIALDEAPYGTRLPDTIERVILGLTQALPANWIGLRASMPLRRMVINRLGQRALDTSAWGVRLRLYPQHNGCEKTALFTPQLFDAVERKALADAVARRLAQGGVFSFIDVGANVGLYSLFVAAQANGKARILAIEPQPGIVSRLRFNIAANPGFDIMVAEVAVADRDAEVELVIDSRDAGGTRLDPTFKTPQSDVVRVSCRPLMALIAEHGFQRIDALKIDVEGSEDDALAPFMREAPDALLPGLIVIEDWGAAWPIDLFAMFQARGYTAAQRSRHNVVLERTTV
jgi:FkbM family methyltransferase